MPRIRSGAFVTVCTGRFSRMKLKVIKKGFNYSQDGTGNRLVYHLQGCNMHCPWCANPESIPLNGTLMIDREKLIDSVCPLGAIKHKKLNRERCKDCIEQWCLNVNRNEGIVQSYFELSIEDIITEVKSARSLFFDHGGVTFTGGEPTLQFETLKKLLQLLHDEHIHTAIETNATHPRLEELFPYLSQVILDLKHIDEEVHKRVTGQSLEKIKLNIEKALLQHKNVLIRTPLIQGFNGDKDYIKDFVEFYHNFDCRNVSFEILKYHEFGKTKWEQCDMPYLMGNGYVTEELREAFEQGYRQEGLHIVRT